MSSSARTLSGTPESDVVIRRHVPTAAQTAAAAPAMRRLVELDQDEALALLAGVAFGRIVFTSRALPAIRPVNHLVDHGEIIIRTHLGGVISDAIGGTGVVVAYEADEIDARERLGWSVVATGYARPITDPDDVTRFEASLTPWVDRALDTVIRIRPEIITGFRLIEAG